MTTPQEALEALRQQFRDQLPERLETLSRHLLVLSSETDPLKRQAELETLHTLSHRLTGTAGTFGMPALSQSARALEKLVTRELADETPPMPSRQSALQDAAENVLAVARQTLANNAPTLSGPAAPEPPSAHPLLFLLEDDALQLAHLKQALEEQGYRVQGFHHADAFRQALSEPTAESPAVVIVDMVLENGTLQGAKLIQELGLGGHEGIPAVVISVRDDLEARLAALRAGACRYLTKPVNATSLAQLLDALSGRCPPTPYRVLLVDDDPLLLESQKLVLESAGMDVCSLAKPLELLETMAQWSPEVVVLDVHMPEVSGPELAAILRERDNYLELPILFLSAETDLQQQLHALNLGGDDFLVKPIVPEHFIEAVAVRARRSRQHGAIRQRLETSLYEQQRVHLTLNHHAIVSVGDSRGNIIEVNDRFCEISGYSRQELLGKNHRIVKSRLHSPAFYRDMWQTISRGDVWKGEICNRGKEGNRYWVESTITPFLDEAGKPYQYVSIRTDITQLKQAELDLKAREGELTTTLDATQDGILAVAPDRRVRFANHRFCQIWGFSPEQACEGAPEWSLLEQAKPMIRQGELFAQRMDAVYQSRDDFHDIIEFIDGRFFEIFSQPVIDGNAIGRVWSFHDITESKRAQAAMEHYKERLRRGQMYANIGTWEWNLQSGELYWTERVAPLFGYPEGSLEVSYDSFINAVHPEDRAPLNAAIKATLEEDAPYDIEHRVVWPDGSVRWLLEQGAVLRDEQGEPVQMLGVVQDIDARKRAELSLAEREYELLEAQHLAHIGSWQFDLPEEHRVWSNEIYRLLGYEPGEIIPSAEEITAHLHPEDRARVEASMVHALKTGAHDINYRIVRPSGEVRYVHELARGERDSQGALLRLSGTVQDITERVEAEKALRESQERFTFAVEGAGDGVWDWDIPGNVIHYSRLYSEMLGYGPEEFSREAHAWENNVHPDDRFLIKERFNAYLKNHQKAYQVEFRLRCKNGHYKWILSRSTVAESDSAGRPTRVIGIHSDIDARKQVETALIHAREEAERANRAKSEFLSSMSHELRTPLNAIIGFGQLLEYEEGLDEEAQDNVAEILTAGRHLLELINDILNLAKVESGQLDVSSEPVAVDEIVEECLGLVRGQATKGGIQITTEALEGAVVRADRTRLKQVLLNLLTNAVKYNREQGQVDVTLAAPDSERLQIRVTDTGRGVAPEDHAALFEPFNRLAAEGSTIEGTGIGLSIARRMTELMGGRLDVESELGVGSCFWVELPGETHQPIFKVVESHAETSLPDDLIEHPPVLYIEDNPANLKVIEKLLRGRRRIQLFTAAIPEQGIILAREQRPALILLDIHMPGMNGFEVLEILREAPETRHIPVVAVSANAMPEDIKRAKRAGFNDYLTKPLDVTAFLETLDAYLKTDDATRNAQR
ncbi:PAS domain-containing protein [Halomonas vilamensis]|uniref:histidine kinase n=1 Tax=Vreelandella vilamensis TaxID=531309 RepID=A0ABU1H7T7_9GAMM|nr:PAS domain-containing protein [Halomonas vilamensis]MDR5900361.1 PAS domain-containing protein [Halomonas vilamensis]